MRKMVFVLATVLIMITLVACGGNTDASNYQTGKTTTTLETSTAEGKNEAGDNTDEEIQNDTQENEIPSLYNGTYTDGTTYLVISNGEIIINGETCDVTKIQTDHFNSGIPVVYFTYEGNENSLFCDEYGISCSVGCEDGWIGFNPIDNADVPNFEDGSGSMAHYMPDEFPYHDSDAEYVSQAMVSGELDFYVVMYTEYFAEVFAKSTEVSPYADKYGNGDLDECYKNGYKFYVDFGTDKSKVGDFSNWGDDIIEIRVTKEYEVQNVLWYLENGDGTFTVFSKMVGDEVILDFICEKIPSQGYKRLPGVVYEGYNQNIEKGEIYEEEFGKGLGLVEYDNCIVYYSK